MNNFASLQFSFLISYFSSLLLLRSYSGLGEGARLGVRVDGEAVLGFKEGGLLGYRLGTTVGHLLGFLDGTLLGARLGLKEGALLGYRLGTALGYLLGIRVGVEGATDGFIEGLAVTGLQLGAPEEGETDGDKEGESEGSTAEGGDEMRLKLGEIR